MLQPTHRVGSSRWEPVSLELGEFYILSMHIDINYILMAMKKSRLLTVEVGCLFLSSSMRTDTYPVG